MLDTECVETVDRVAAAEDSSRLYAVFSSSSWTASVIRQRRPMSLMPVTAAAAADLPSRLCKTLRTKRNKNHALFITVFTSFSVKYQSLFLYVATF